jgi:uncharacterized protein (DUF433 family)
MTLATSYPHITKSGHEPAHLLRLPRVRVAQIVMDWIAHGWTAEEMCRQHPYLTPAEAHAAMAYYYDHVDEIEAEIQAESNSLLKLPASRSPFYARMKAQGML